MLRSAFLPLVPAGLGENIGRILPILCVWRHLFSDFLFFIYLMYFKKIADGCDLAGKPRLGDSWKRLYLFSV